MIVLIDDAEPITLGETETTPTIGIVDYSRRVTDDFGVTTVVPRGFSRRMSVRLALPTDAADGVQRSLAALRASAAQWIADDRFAWLSPMGYYKDFEVDLAVPPLSFCTLSVEGLAETDSVPDAGEDPAPDGAESTFRMLRPLAVTDTLLASSTVPEDDEPEWGGGTTYPLAFRVMRPGSHRIYESLIAGNIGHAPESSPTYWLDVGPTNRWAMFDEALGTATGAAAGPMVVTFSVDGIGALSLLDVVGDSVRIEVMHASSTVYDQTIAADGGSLKFLDLPVVAGTVRVTIVGVGAVSVGTLLIGDIVGLGLTEASPTAGITDFSRKVVDDFGEVSIVQRGWSKRMTAKALIDTAALDIVADRIAAVRARPVLWIGDADIDSLSIYGFFRDFSIEVGESVSKLSLSIEGLSKALPLAPLIDLSPISLRIDEVESDLARVVSDGFLGRAEKPRAKIDWEAINALLSALNDRFVALGSPADILFFRDDGNDKVGDLGAYLSGLDPAWDDSTVDTPIVAAAYRGAWVDAYSAVSSFQAAVTGRHGPGGFTLIPVGYASVGPNTVTFTGPPGGAYNFMGGAKTLEFFTGGAYCSARYPSLDTGNAAIFALDDVPTLDPANIGNGWYLRSNGTYDIIIDGTELSGGSGLAARTADMVFSIAYKGDKVYFYVDGTLIHTRTWYPDVKVCFIATLTAATLQDITYGPVGPPGVGGPPGLTIPPIGNIDVACYSDGTPKTGEFNKVVQIKVFQGDSDVTESCSFTRSDSDATSTVSNTAGSRGRVTFTAIAAETGYSDVTATLPDVAPVLLRIAIAKRRDAVSPSPQYPAMSFGGAPTITAVYGTQVALANGATLSARCALNTVSSSAAGSVTAQIQIAPSGSGSWTALTSGSATGSVGAFEPANLDFTGTYTNSSGAPKVYDLRVVVTKTGGAITVDYASSFLQPA